MFYWIDGSSCYTPGLGKRAGAAFVCSTGYYESKYLGDKGSNLAELEAFGMAVDHCAVSAIIYTDSKFVYNSYYKKTKIKHGSHRMDFIRRQVDFNLELIFKPGSKKYNNLAQHVDWLARDAAQSGEGRKGWLELSKFLSVTKDDQQEKSSTQ